MKLLSGISVLLFSLSAAIAAPNDLMVDARSFVSITHDEMITKITNARANILVASNGPILRRDCFKQYRLNLPHAPQTVSYTIEMNIPVKVTKTSIALEKVIDKANEMAQKLRSRIFTGCRTDISIMTLIDGETTNGLMKSELQFFITKDGVKVQSGALQEKITPGVAKSVNLIPTVFNAEQWAAMWSQFDPASVEPRRNY
jgi:hypothetical protein